MPIFNLFKGFGSAPADRVGFANDTKALAVYVVGDDGLPDAAGQTPISYVPATGGIITTVAVTIAVAVAGKINRLTSMLLQNGSSTGTEVEIHNGAAGPTIWRGYAAPNSSQVVIFSPAIAGSVGALLEIQALTTAAKIYATVTGTVV